MNVPWNDIELFLAVAETTSLTAAAVRLRITQPTASRQLAQLESLLGERIFNRSVSGVTLTSFGERLLEPAKRMAEWAGEVYRASDASPGPKLEDLRWIAWAPPFDFSPNPELRARIPGFEPVFASDDYLIQIRAAEHGLGAIVLGRSHKRFASFSLVDLKVDLDDVKRALHLVCAKSALDIPRIRTVSDLLSEFIRKPQQSRATRLKNPRTRTRNL
jgi:DNA-binding transcriptional LysR family regulator